MASGNLMIGISALAFAAGTAAAQTGEAPAATPFSQTGENNAAQVENGPRANENRSTIRQGGNNNSTIVEQIGIQNISDVRQVGDFNAVQHRRSGDRNSAVSAQEGNSHSSTATQQGNDNVGVVIQVTGSANSSTILQGVRADAISPGINGNRNKANVAQRGSDNVSTVRQQALVNSAAGIEISDNAATVVQGVHSLLSTGNISSIVQESRGNVAELFQFEGGSSALARNESTITQQHSKAVNTSDPTSTTLSNNRASVAIRGQGNVSSVAQNGFSNYAEVTLQAGGAERDPQTGRREGNQSGIDQSGTELAAVVVAARTDATNGRANLSDIRQTGNNHRAVAWQRGVLDTLSILQQNGGSSGTYSDGGRVRAAADVSQRGHNNSVHVAQIGDNFAEVTQGLGQLSSVAITQTDAGDLTTVQNPADAANRQRNRAAVAQYGNANSATIAQDSLNADAIVWQKTGSSDGAAGVQQGTGATATANFASTFFRATASEVSAASRNLSANVTQGAARNHAEVLQDGVGLTATVEQFGTGAAGLSNSVRIAQQGTGNSATARQHITVGPSTSTDVASGRPGDEFYFAGGARSAEITILQSNSGNAATVQQSGRGQVARIEQSGQNNVSSVVQLELATNATAVLRQSGNGNSYSITQSQAGQYMAVTQTGSDNKVTSLVQRGPGS